MYKNREELLKELEYELQEVNNKLGALKKAIDLAVKLKN